MDNDSREDFDCGFDAYCPRTNQEIFILSGACFFPGRDRVCQGCVYDSNAVFCEIDVVVATEN